MDPRGGPFVNSHPQRPADSAVHNIDLGLAENGGVQGDWREGDEETGKYVPWTELYEPSESVRSQSRFSSSTTTSTRKPSIWRKIRGKNETWSRSLKAVILSSWVNIFILVVPVLWTLHFLNLISHVTSFALSFLALLPIIKLLDFSAENLALYCGQDVGDLILISLNNAVEAILALYLLASWQLRLLQSSIIGVVVLRLLLIPGVSFIVGGARVATQELHPHITGLNHSLLTMGVLAFLLPIAFFTALDRGIISNDAAASLGIDTNVVSDYMRNEMLKVSRGMAIILLAVYICSRVYLHNPPGGELAFEQHDDSSKEQGKQQHAADNLEEEVPAINFSMAVIVSLISVTLMALTAEILVESIEPMRDKFSYSDEWFGLILLPMVSFSADALVSIVNFVRNTFFGHSVPHTMASYRHVDDAIQFIMFWAPVLVLLGWIMQRPMSLLFDLFEVAILIGSCFLLNYVTEDSKTNWAEGFMLVALYVMIALSAWFYPQQPEIGLMLSRSSIAQALQDSNLGNDLGSSPSSSAAAISTIFSTSTAHATATTTSTAIATATTTISTTTGISQPTPTAVSSLLSGDGNGSENKVLSEKLQELVELYDILLVESKKVQDAVQSELSKSSTTSAMPSQKTQSAPKEVSRERRIRYAKYD
jgi:Ca2+:H+ antiporter